MHATRLPTLLATALLALAAQAADIAGGKDHPLLSRYAGSQLDGYEERNYASGSFFLPAPGAPAKELQREQPLGVEGRLTRLLYLAPKGRTALEVHRNFEQALRTAGAEIKTAVNGKDASWEAAEHWRLNFTGMTLQSPWAADVSPFWRDGLYLYAVLRRGERLAHVSVLTAQHYASTETQTAVAVQVVEPAALQTGQVTVNAEALRQGLAAEGKVALYGIYFDTGKAELKAESKPQLEQMARLLREQQPLRVFIVGHTDNQGAFEANLALSQRRAEAVVAALTAEHKIDRSRLAARGAANIAPVAGNGSEAGRARNRRVELVAQ